MCRMDWRKKTQVQNDQKAIKVWTRGMENWIKGHDLAANLMSRAWGQQSAPKGSAVGYWHCLELPINGGKKKPTSFESALSLLFKSLQICWHAHGKIAPTGPHLCCCCMEVGNFSGLSLTPVSWRGLWIEIEIRSKSRCKNEFHFVHGN